MQMTVALSIIILALIGAVVAMLYYGLSRTMIWIGIHMLANAQSLIRAGQDWGLRDKQREADLHRLAEEYL
jgi:hypothetical protein